VNRSTSHRRRVALAVGATALATAGLLTGCGSGQVAQTAEIVPAVPGANLDLTVDGGLISVRDATVDYPGPQGYQPGEDAPLTIRIINSTPSPVTLTGVTAKVADGTTSLGTVLQVGGVPSAAPSEESPVVATPTRNPTPRPSPSGMSSPASPSPGGSASAGSAASASASALPSGAVRLGGSPTIKVPIPAYPTGLIILSRANIGGTYLTISGLTRPLRPGMSARLVLTFTLADGSTVALGASNLPGQQLVVPVGVPLSPQPRSPLAISGD
jgi:hypothetical protein